MITDMIELKSCVDSLKKSPLYNLSMANKELFHSNFLAWFGNQYKNEFKVLMNKLLGTEVLKDNNFSIEREYKHFDICVKVNGNEIILIENKVKSVPTSEQLEGYMNEVKNNECKFILLTMTQELQDLSNAEGWTVISYRKLSENMPDRLNDCYHSSLLEDYRDYVNNLQDIIEIYDKEENYNSKPEDNRLKDELGIHDICGKRKAQTLYKKLCEACKNKNIVSDINNLSDNNIYIGWGYTNSTPLIEVKFKPGKDVSDVVIIQIQGKQYRHAVEFFDKAIGERIIYGNKEHIPSDKGLSYLKEHYSDILSLNGEKPQNYPFDECGFGQNKKRGYCKYCNGKPNANGDISCFVYQWVEIPKEITCDELIDIIVKDTSNMKEILKKNKESK